MSLNKSINFHVGEAMLVSVNQLVSSLEHAAVLSSTDAEANFKQIDVQKYIVMAQNHAQNLQWTLLEEIRDEESWS